LLQAVVLEVGLVTSLTGKPEQVALEALPQELR
jgi:hypothetical protein